MQIAVLRGSVRKQSLSSILCLLSLLSFYALAYISLLWLKPDFLADAEPLASSWIEWLKVFQELVQQYLVYSTLQAGFSATLILSLSWLGAKALTLLPVRWQSGILALTNLSFSLPTILVVYALLAVLGTQGWLNQLLQEWGSEPLVIYGLAGIVLANLYFNWGYGINVIWHSLQQLPQEYYELALSCGMHTWQRWRWIELPQLKNQLLNLWLLLFLLCFNAFALILFLGGGPKYANLEVAIYQSLTSDLDFARASVIALLQLTVSGLLILVVFWKHQTSLREGSHSTSWSTTRAYLISLGHYLGAKRCIAWIVAVIAIAFVIIPLLTVICAGILSWWHLDAVQSWWYGIPNYGGPQGELGENLAINPHSYDWKLLGDAFTTSLWLGGGASLLCISISIVILRGLRWHSTTVQLALQNLSLLSLAIPSLLLGAGYYLIFSVGLETEIEYPALIVLLIFANTANSLVYALNYLAPVYNQIQTYNHLVLCMRMTGWHSFTKVEWPFISRSVWQAMVNVFIITIGDFSIIIFFASQDITSLTYLLAQQMEGFQASQGNITALILLSLILVLRLLANFCSSAKK